MGERVQEDLHLSEEQWTADGFYGKENQFSSRAWTMAHTPVDGPTPIQIWTERTGLSGIQKERRSKRNNKVKRERDFWL